MKKIIFLCCATLLLSSCHIYKSYKRSDEIKVASDYRIPESMAVGTATDSSSIGYLKWNELFLDSDLQTLIQKGLENNVDLQSAILRVEEAKAGLMSARLAYLPSLALTPNGALSGTYETTPVKTYQLPAAASWQLDLFGSLLNAKKEAKANMLQAENYKQAVRSQLISGIASTYFALQMLDRQLKVTEDNISLLKETVRTMEEMMNAGMTNAAAISQTKGLLLQTEATSSELKLKINTTENALSVLLAENPQRIERTSLDSEVMPDKFAIGVPVMLLSNRPDVKATEMALAASYYRVNQARSSFYPNITISGQTGWTNGLGSAIVNPGKLVYQAVASLSQPIFAKGKLIANLKVTKAEEKIAQMNFQQSILNAGKEVSDALYLYDANSDMLDKHVAQVDEANKAVMMTKELFNAGKSTYLEVLNAQQLLLNAQLNEASDRYQLLNSVVDLYSALGGGKE